MQKHVLLKFKWIYWGTARSRGLLGWSMVRGQGRCTTLKFHNSTRSPSLGQASGHKVEYHSKHIFLPKLGQICALKKQVSARVPHCCLGTRSAANLCPQTKIIYFDLSYSSLSGSDESLKITPTWIRYTEVPRIFSDWSKAYHMLIVIKYIVTIIMIFLASFHTIQILQNYNKSVPQRAFLCSW